MGQLKLPPGKKVAVSLGVDFDAQSLWLGAFNMPSPAMMARGEFGAAVGMPRLSSSMAKISVGIDTPKSSNAITTASTFDAMT